MFDRLARTLGKIIITLMKKDVTSHQKLIITGMKYIKITSGLSLKMTELQ